MFTVQVDGDARAGAAGLNATASRRLEKVESRLACMLLVRRQDSISKSRAQAHLHSMHFGIWGPTRGVRPG